MENESNLISNFDFVEDNIFRTEYENQNIHNIRAFKNWQNSNIKKNGKDIKLFHCLDDKIYFYVSDYKCQEYPFYKAKCPKCNKYICYCCLSIDIDMHFDCCLKRRIYNCFHNTRDFGVDGPADHLCYCCRSKLIYMIPFLNIIAIIGSIARILYYQRDCKFKNGFYEGNLKDNHKWNIMMFINSMFAIALSIPFISYNIIFALFIWIISIPFIPFYFAPVRYVATVINNGF